MYETFDEETTTMERTNVARFFVCISSLQQVFYSEKVKINNNVYAIRVVLEVPCQAKKMWMLAVRKKRVLD